jgi:hypothetical protein
MDPSQKLDALRLYLLGLTTLFLELVLIRYLAGSVWNLGYFPNLVLIAVFIGMGLGFVFHRACPEAFSPHVARASSVLVMLIALLVLIFTPGVPGMGGWAAHLDDELYFTTTPKDGAQDSWLFAALFALVVAVFAAISQRTAKLFRSFAPLSAYTLDISGSCTGIALFMLMSWLSLPAWIWMLMLIPLLLLACVQGRETLVARVWPVLPWLVTIGVVQYQDLVVNAAPERTDVQTVWSPYQKLQLTTKTGDIYANGILHQSMMDKPSLPPSFYRLPYESRKQRGLSTSSVMVIGAGSGNDVAAALAYADPNVRVDAVEIDPGIQSLGRAHHPLRPYADPRVRLTVDDGRAFMTRADRKYDLIIIALTDSLVKVSAMAQLRLENYLFTRNSVARAYSLLTPQGELVFYNYYRTLWLVNKIVTMAREGTRREPRLIYRWRDMVMLAVGPSTVGGGFGRGPQIEAPTDDWPFLYLKERSIPSVYVRAMLVLFALVVVVLGTVHVRSLRDPERQVGLPLKLAFLLMGVAFLLLETKSVIQFSLLFGTTWLNSSLVFLSVLLLVLAANWLAYRLSRERLWPIAALLVASSLVPLAYPLDRLLGVPSPLLRFVFASLLTFTPIFFANLLFSLSFRDQKLPEHLFGWNLVGATLGGLLEYTSMQLGYAMLAALVAAIYTAVALLLFVAQRSAPAITNAQHDARLAQPGLTCVRDPE